MRNFLAFTILCFAIAPLAVAQQYTGIVLYPLTAGIGGGITSSYSQSSIAAQTVGYGSATDGNTHALLWSTNGSMIDLNPAGVTNSQLFATDGFQQVGNFYSTSTGNYYHAMLWSGTSASAVDLNPAGFTRSNAYGVAGNEQVGEGFGSTTAYDDHALLWSSTAASVVDLNPTGFEYSEAYGIAGGHQVGYGWGSQRLTSIRLILPVFPVRLPSASVGTNKWAGAMAAGREIIPTPCSGSGPPHQQLT
jgi:probable HAF family extracellular repeat protein